MSASAANLADSFSILSELVRTCTIQPFEFLVHNTRCYKTHAHQRIDADPNPVQNCLVNNLLSECECVLGANCLRAWLGLLKLRLHEGCKQLMAATYLVKQSVIWIIIRTFAWPWFAKKASCKTGTSSLMLTVCLWASSLCA